MTSLSREQLDRVRRLMTRAAARLGGAEAVAARARVAEGEFDNAFDGAVSGIFHVVDAIEIMTSGQPRQMREAEQPTRIHSALAELNRARVRDVPAAVRLIDLNRRRNTSVHGDWLEVLDQDELADAVRAGQALLRAAGAYAVTTGIKL